MRNGWGAALYYFYILGLLFVLTPNLMGQTGEWIYTGGPEYAIMYDVYDTIHYYPLEIETTTVTDTIRDWLHDIEISGAFPNYMLVSGYERVWRYSDFEDDWVEICDLCTLYRPPYSFDQYQILKMKLSLADSMIVFFISHRLGCFPPPGVCSGMLINKTVDYFATSEGYCYLSYDFGYSFEYGDIKNNRYYPNDVYGIGGCFWYSPDLGETWVCPCVEEPWWGCFEGYDIEILSHVNRVLLVAERGIKKIEIPTMSLSVFASFSEEVTEIAINPTDSNIIYAAVKDSGIYKTTDCGEHWLHLCCEPHFQFIVEMIINPVYTSMIYIATRYSGIYRSINSGITWESINEGLPGSFVSDLEMDPFDHTKLYVALRDTGELIWFGDCRGVYLYTEYSPLQFISEGWNLLSPQRSSEVPTLSCIFPFSLPPAFGYSPSIRAYFTTDTLDIGNGYWVYSLTDTLIPVLGDTISSYTDTLFPGWNIIGSISYPVPVSYIFTYLEFIPPLFGYSSTLFSYEEVDTIQPGMGYWILATDTVEFTLSLD